MANVQRVMMRNKEMPSFFGQTEFKGEKVFTDTSDYCIGNPQLYYKHQNGELWLGDSIEWLKTLKSKSVDLIFADPPYNIKKTDWDNFESQEEYIKWSMLWIEQAARVLKDAGTLYICGFSEILADLKHPASKYFKSCRWIVWHYKNKANLAAIGEEVMKVFYIFVNQRILQLILMQSVFLMASIL